MKIWTRVWPTNGFFFWMSFTQPHERSRVSSVADIINRASSAISCMSGNRQRRNIVSDAEFASHLPLITYQSPVLWCRLSQSINYYTIECIGRKLQGSQWQHIISKSRSQPHCAVVPSDEGREWADCWQQHIASAGRSFVLWTSTGDLLTGALIDIFGDGRSACLPGSVARCVQPLCFSVHGLSGRLSITMMMMMHTSGQRALISSHCLRLSVAEQPRCWDAARISTILACRQQQRASLINRLACIGFGSSYVLMQRIYARLKTYYRFPVISFLVKMATLLNELCRYFFYLMITICYELLAYRLLHPTFCCGWWFL